MSVSEFTPASGATPSDTVPAAPARWSPAIWAGAAVCALTVLGLVIRLVVLGQPLFADELSTYWISATHSLGGVIKLMYSVGPIKHAEITPPVYFVLAWLTTQFGHTAELLRLPAFIAGVLTVPAVYVLGLRTVGRRAAVVACAIAALSPFMIYYSTEARAYGVMMLLVVVSTIALLQALETGRRRWWVLYAVCVAGAFLSHYTCAFVLGAQVLWVLVFHAEARRKVILATVGAGVLMLPWAPGFIQDYKSPTTVILSNLSPFSPHAVGVDLVHWAVGYPYAKLPGLPQIPGWPPGLSQIPGWPAIVLIVAGALVGLAGLLWRRRGSRIAWAELDRGFLLVAALALATPLGEAVVSAVSTHIFGVRNLAASWVPAALLFACLLKAPRGRIAVLAAALALVGFLLAGLRMLDGTHQRPLYQRAADYVDRTATSGDVVLDETGNLSPGPLTALDVSLHRRLAIVRALAPEERTHPFTFGDPYVSVATASRQAVRVAAGRRIFVVGGLPPDTRLPGYRLVAAQGYAGLSVDVFARAGGQP